jgi:type 2 lantibiotic biosynthesis protein LanM
MFAFDMWAGTKYLKFSIITKKMKFCKDFLIEIVCKASTINERLETDFFSNNAQINDAIVNSRVEKWCQRAAQGNWEKFEKRLAWDGLDLSTIRRVLGYVCIVNDSFATDSFLETLPAWVETLQQAMQAAAAVYLEILEKGNLNEYRCLDPQEPLPFEELFLPFINVARQNLIAQAGSNYSLLSESAQATLERSLLMQLSGLGSQAMELQFSIFRNFQQSSLARLLKPIPGNLSQEQYQAFIKGMLSGKLLSFFRKYSVLARLLVVATDLWVDATREFLQRLGSDWYKIQRTFQGETELGQVDAVESALSDPHNNGRTAIAVKFTSGLKLIYKPKDLGTEQAYFNLLAWFNDRGSPLPFKLLQVLNRSTHGWVEFVEHLPCQNQEEAKRYYQRGGMLLCVIHALKGNDCHGENIIACGEHPVLVDMETLMHHRVWEVEKLEDEAEVQSLANEQLWNSVMRTSFLPNWNSRQNKRVAYDVSGLGGVDEQDVPFRVMQWQNINTDSMTLKYENGKRPSFANVPSLDGINLSPENYVEEIVSGFRQMYQFLLAHRDAILATNGPLVALARHKVRFLFRDTFLYEFLLQRTYHPKFLRDGADRGIELDVLSRPLLASDSKPLLWPLLRVEQQALAQLDIPYFSVGTDSNALALSPNQIIENSFKEPSYALVVSYLNQLNDADLEQQIGFIRGSLCSRMMPKPHNSLLSEKSTLNFAAINRLTPEEIMIPVMAMAAELQQRAIRSADGSTTWIALGYLPEAEKYQLQALDYGLFDGACGVALFLAALEKVTGGAGFRELALGALQPVCKNLQKPQISQKFAKKIGIGGGLGLGSIIYTLVRSSLFLGEPDLLEDARQIASLIAPDRIDADRQFDIIFGAAGAILGLLALYKTSADPIVLEQTITCGHHLLSHRVASDSGYRAWATLNGRLLTGISHGAAGIAYALLQLYATTQEQVFREAAEEAIAYERSVFSKKAGNWPDFRGSTNHDGSFGFANSWCNGAPGIGLARLGSLAVLDTDEIRQDIEIALKTTLQCGLQEIDHLCCGNFGRIELLLAAAVQLSRIELMETAQKQAAWVVARAEKDGSFCLMPGFTRNVYMPGFFQGTAGIGYELLRFAYPDLLPSILLWQ